MRAVRWAAEEARRRGLPLRLVHALQIPFRYPLGVVKPESFRDLLREQGDRWLAEARAAASACAPDVQVARLQPRHTRRHRPRGAPGWVALPGQHHVADRECVLSR